MAQFVDPHVTLVFPTTALSNDQLNVEVSKLIEGIAPFKVILRSALLMPEIVSSRSQAHIFLVPDEGFGDLVRLHDRLYSGRLRPALRLDISFVPHLTVGAAIDLERAKNLVDQLNSKRFEIEFTVKELFVVKIEDGERDRRLSNPISLT